MKIPCALQPLFNSCSKAGRARGSWQCQKPRDQAGAEPGFPLPEALLHFSAASCRTRGPSGFLARSPAAAPGRSILSSLPPAVNGSSHSPQPPVLPSPRRRPPLATLCVSVRPLGLPDSTLLCDPKRPRLGAGGGAARFQADPALRPAGNPRLLSRARHRGRYRHLPPGRLPSRGATLATGPRLLRVAVRACSRPFGLRTPLSIPLPGFPTPPPSLRQPPPPFCACGKPASRAPKHQADTVPLALRQRACAPPPAATLVWRMLGVTGGRLFEMEGHVRARQLRPLAEPLLGGGSPRVTVAADSRPEPGSSPALSPA